MSAREPGCYAVIFTSRLGDDDEGYAQTAARMVERAAAMPGFLGIDTARDGEGLGITVSYWRDEAAIAAWKADAEHTAAREKGRRRWYEGFDVHVARIERSYTAPAQAKLGT